MSKWYAVPAHTDPDNTTPVPLRPATVVDEYGQEIAQFESLQHAESAVIAFNQRYSNGRGMPSFGVAS